MRKTSPGLTSCSNAEPEDNSVLEALERLREKDGFFSHLSTDEILGLAHNSEEVRCAMGEHLIVPGQSKDYLYIVLEGEIAAFVSVAKDEEHILMRLGPVVW